jgi:hypothetical protein
LQVAPLPISELYFTCLRSLYYRPDVVPIRHA